MDLHYTLELSDIKDNYNICHQKLTYDELLSIISNDFNIIYEKAEVFLLGEKAAKILSITQEKGIKANILFNDYSETNDEITVELRSTIESLRLHAAIRNSLDSLSEVTLEMMRASLWESIYLINKRTDVIKANVINLIDNEIHSLFSAKVFIMESDYLKSTLFKVIVYPTMSLNDPEEFHVNDIVQIKEIISKTNIIDHVVDILYKDMIIVKIHKRIGITAHVHTYQDIDTDKVCIDNVATGLGIHLVSDFLSLIIDGELSKENYKDVINATKSTYPILNEAGRDRDLLDYMLYDPEFLSLVSNISGPNYNLYNVITESDKDSLKSLNVNYNEVKSILRDFNFLNYSMIIQDAVSGRHLLKITLNKGIIPMLELSEVTIPEYMHYLFLHGALANNTEEVNGLENGPNFKMLEGIASGINISPHKFEKIVEYLRHLRSRGVLK